MADLQKFRLVLPARNGRRLLEGGGGRGPNHRGPTTIEEVVRRYAPRPAATGSLLLFDATGSMSPYWNHVSTTLNEMFGRFLGLGEQPSLRVVAFRDDCDGDRVIERSPWSSDVGELQRFLSAVVCSGGGDRPEAVDRALRVAVDEQLPVASVILLGDAPPHEQRDGRPEAKALGTMSRPVFPIVIGGAPDTRMAFDEIARLSGGKRIDLDRLEELYDVLGVVLARSGGGEALDAYVGRHRHLLTPGGERAARLLTDGTR
jgi:hypothetical protein